LKIDNIVTKKSYINAEGKEKNIWLNVGCLKTTDKGQRFVELNMFPGTPFYVFERKDKEGVGGAF